MSTPVAARLSDVILEAWLKESVGALFPPELVAKVLREAALFHLRSAHAEESVAVAIAAAQRYFANLGEGLSAGPGQARLRDALPKEVLALLRALLSLPYTPNRAWLVGILSREPFRRLNREIMLGTLLDYSRRLRTTVADGGLGKGLGALGRLAGEAVKKSTSALGSIAPGMTSAIQDEFEQKMQRRTAEFAEGAVDEMVQRVATTLTDPLRAAEHTELKLALLDFVLDLRGAEVARELDRLSSLAAARELRVFMLAWLEREPAVANLAAGIAWLQKELGGQPQTVPAPLYAALHGLLAHALHPAIESGAVRRALDA